MNPRPVTALPTPKLLGSISPSRFTAIEACVLKEACSGGKNSNLLPRFPKGFLGTVAHKLVEMGAKGLLTGEQGSPAVVWEKLVTEEETRIAQNLIEAHLIPLKRSCAEYFLIRARAIRAASQLASSVSLPRNAASQPADGLGYEIGVSSEDGIVKGRIDAVTVVDGALTISDYKTGAILLEDAGVTQIKPEYEAQLKLYAAVYHRTYGRWPDRLLLLNLQGKDFEVTFSREECDLLLVRAKEMFERTNNRIQVALQHGNAASLANPSPAVCRFCAFRPGCKSYCEARQSQPDAGWPRDIWGRIETKTVSSIGLWAACLSECSVPGEKAVIRRLSGGSRHPQFQEAAQGSAVAAFGLRKEGGSETYAESPTTVVYRFA